MVKLVDQHDDTKDVTGAAFTLFNSCVCAKVNLC